MSTIETNTNQTLARMDGAALQPASVNFDVEKYRAEVDEFDITEDQKRELLLTLFSIMRSFVELGFSVDICSALLSDNSTIPIDDGIS